MSEGPSAGTRTMVDSSVGEGELVAGAGGHGAARIGRYAILERLGSGGMGEVFAAYDDQLDRKIALKVLHRGRSLSEAARARLMREAQALARVSHPNVVTVYETGIHEDRVFIAMEFIRGQTVAAWLRGSRRSWAEIVELFAIAGEGLAAMHEHDLVHRDFKPANVLVDERGRPRLIDFGLVRLLEPDDSEATEPVPDGSEPEAAPTLPDSLTRTGALVGTPLYMSPEQFMHQPATPASDQFSLCVALYEAIYGGPPFAGTSPAERAISVLSGVIEPPLGLTDAPAELLAVLTRGLRRDPEERWPDMQTLVSALRSVLATYDPELEDPEASRTRRRLLVGLIGVGISVLVTFGVISSQSGVGFTPASVVGLDTAMLAIVGGAMALSRRYWSTNRHRRRMVALLLLVLTTFLLHDLTGLLTGRALYHSFIANAVSLTALCLFAAPVTTPVLRWGALWTGLWTIVMIVDPPRYFLYFNIGVLGTGLVAAIAFPRPPVERWVRTAASEGGRSNSRGDLSRSSGGRISVVTTRARRSGSHHAPTQPLR